MTFAIEIDTSVLYFPERFHWECACLLSQHNCRVHKEYKMLPHVCPEQVKHRVKHHQSRECRSNSTCRIHKGTSLLAWSIGFEGRFSASKCVGGHELLQN
eukprot:3293403-Amphidinium_carterae.1